MDLFLILWSSITCHFWASWARKTLYISLERPKTKLLTQSLKQRISVHWETWNQFYWSWCFFIQEGVAVFLKWPHPLLWKNLEARAFKWGIIHFWISCDFCILDQNVVLKTCCIVINVRQSKTKVPKDSCTPNFQCLHQPQSWMNHNFTAL